MKKMLFVLLSSCLLFAFKTDSKEIRDCKCNGIPLHGKVKFVTSFPNFKIKYVDNFPDLRVKFVSSHASSCGEWQVVDSYPDFTVMVVNDFPDFTIKTVESFPGM